MKKKHKIFMVTCIILSFFTGCSENTGNNLKVNKETYKVKNKTEKSTISIKGEQYPFTITDSLGKDTILEEMPKKVAVLSGTPLNIWYDLKGKSVCSSDVSKNLKVISEHKEEILALPKIGPVYSIDMEAVISQKPDLIIAQSGVQETQAEKFRDMGFNVILTKVKSYKDVVDTYNVFGKILHNENVGLERINKLNMAKEEIMSRVPKDGKSAVILYVTSKTVAAKLDNSIAGDVAKMLNIENIASKLPPDTIGSESTPLDIEYIVEKNPEYILVTSMISNNQTAKKIMEEEFKNNPTWKGLKAIEEGKVVYLPQEYFLYNAGPYYDEAIEYMAKGVYPEIYGKVQQ